jgi:hypothetical protein
MEINWIGVIAAIVTAVIGWILGRRKSSGSLGHVGPGDPGGIAANLESSADEVGELAGEIADSAAAFAEVAADLGTASDIIDELIDEAGSDPGDHDRAQQLLDELRRRHGEGIPESQNTE